MLIIILVILVALFFCNKKLNKKTIKVRKNVQFITVDEKPIEYSDMNHYINTRLLYERKRNVIEEIIRPELHFDTDIEQVPDIIEYHLNEDTQNVHDTVIQKNIKSAFDKTSKLIHNYKSTLEEILDYSKNEKVKEILEKIDKRNAYISNLKCNENEVIERVWSSSDDNIKSQFINEILDCVDKNGFLYCPTGVVTRITSAVYINNPDMAPKTKKMLNQEVMQKFGYYYSINNDKLIAKEKTINDYYSVYPKETIAELIDEWIEHV